MTVETYVPALSSTLTLMHMACSTLPEELQ